MRLDATYDPAFYETIRPGVKASAEAILPRIMREFPHTTNVADIGCGEGWWMRYLAVMYPQIAQHGMAVGLDGEHVVAAAKQAHEGVVGLDFMPVDLTVPLHHQASFIDINVAFCLEVAEHLDAEHAQRLVDDLKYLAPVVVFSAAIPGQSGAHHVNCQWQSYWAERFADTRGGDMPYYTPLPGLRWEIWGDETVEPWYRQNLVVYVRDGTQFPTPWTHGPLDVVHPAVYGWKL